MFRSWDRAEDTEYETAAACDRQGRARLTAPEPQGTRQPIVSRVYSSSGITNG